MEPVDDLDLLDRWRAGDVTAGNALFRRHFESLYRFFDRKVDGEVDELVQETFLGCVRGRDSFRKESSFRTYLFGVARYTLYGYWRRRARDGLPLQFEEVSVASLSTSVGTRLARREDQAQLLRALRELPVEQQLLLELHYWEGLDSSQLAEVFGVEEATTRSRLFRARQSLRAHLAREPSAPQPPGDDGFDVWARSLRAEFEPLDPTSGTIGARPTRS